MCISIMSKFGRTISIDTTALRIGIIGGPDSLKDGTGVFFAQ